MTRQTGRPADETGRLAKEIRTYDFWMQTMYGMSGLTTKQR